MDLKALIAKSIPSKGEQIPAPTAAGNGDAGDAHTPSVPICICGHEHDPGTSCDVMDCDCLIMTIRIGDSYMQPSSPVGIVGSGVVELPSPPDESQKLFNIPPQPEVPIEAIAQRPTEDEPEDPNACNHMCEKCDAWFSHGAKNLCRHPGLIRYGLCKGCLNGGTTADPLAEVEEDSNGRLKLTPQHEIKVRNAERIDCKDMTIEQLSFHIRMLDKYILELRAKQVESRKMKSDAIEEEVANVPEEEREAFRAALMAGKVKKVKAPKKESKKDELERVTSECLRAGTPVAMAAIVAKLMIQTGKDRLKVEAMLND